MSNDLPIACTLTEAEMPARRAEMAAVAADLVAAEVEATRAVLRFRTGPETRARVAAIVAAEAQCCAFLQMQLRDEHGGLTLTIEGPDGSELVVRELVGAFGA